MPLFILFLHSAENKSGDGQSTVPHVNSLDAAGVPHEEDTHKNYTKQKRELFPELRLVLPDSSPG